MENKICKEQPGSTGNDEVDGGIVSRIRRKRGVKVTGKYIPPLEWEKIDTSNSSSSSSHSYFEEIYDDRENSADTVLHINDNMPVKQLLQDERQGIQYENNRADIAKLEKEKQAMDAKQVKSTQAVRDNTIECIFLEKKKNNTLGLKTSTEKLPLRSAIPKETIDELKNLLKESPLLKSKTKYTNQYNPIITHLQLPKENVAEKSNLTFETFRPRLGSSNQKLQSKKTSETKASNNQILTGTAQPPQVEQFLQPFDGDNSIISSRAETEIGAEFTDLADCSLASNKYQHPCSSSGIPKSLQVISHIEHIKQQIAREDICFVRFEAADLHGVSRSRTIPSRFFHEKAVNGVFMPRSYLELTIVPKDNEENHVHVGPFNSDIMLMPELPTFRVLPWAEKNGRVICESYTVMGDPLLTSPRYLAKQLLNQLQDYGLSLQAAFSYEFYIFGVAEMVNSKTFAFPAATLLTDQLFMQELFDGMYYTGVSIESFSSSSAPGQIEISLEPEYGLTVADNAFTFRTGLKEIAKKHGYIASFYTDAGGICNSGNLSHSLHDINGTKNMFYNESQDRELSDIGRKWLSGLLLHSAALSCLAAPGVSCRKHFSKFKHSTESFCASWGFNDNSCAYNIKCHNSNGIYIENRLGSATANPYLVLAATIAAGLDGIKSSLDLCHGTSSKSGLPHLITSPIPLKMEDALISLKEDKHITAALGEDFIQYFIAVKRYELETEEIDSERNKFLEYFN
ncbi:lengsin [Rhinophrynus dorsalis]